MLAARNKRRFVPSQAKPQKKSVFLGPETGFSKNEISQGKNKFSQRKTGISQRKTDFSILKSEIPSRAYPK